MRLLWEKNTWENLPKKPLQKRDNLILSTTLNIKENSPKNNFIKSFNNIKDIEKFCEEQQYDTVWIICGSTVYNHYITYPKLNHIYVLLEYECDTYFPCLSGWSLIENELKILQDKRYVYYLIYVK